MQLIRKSRSLVKLNLRLAAEKLKAVSELRQNRDLYRWLNTWIAEVIPEKLTRLSQGGKGGARDA